QFTGQLVNEFTSSTGEKSEHLGLRTQVSNLLSAVILTGQRSHHSNEHPSFTRSTCSRTNGACVGECEQAHIIGKQIEVRAWRLRQSQWPLRPEQKTFSADRSEQLGQLILRRTPDPRNVPEHSLLLCV